MQNMGVCNKKNPSLPPPQGAVFGDGYPTFRGPLNQCFESGEKSLFSMHDHISFAIADTWPLKCSMKPSTWSTSTPLSVLISMPSVLCTGRLLEDATLEVPFFLPSLLLPPRPECQATWEPGFWLQPPFFSQLVRCLMPVRVTRRILILAEGGDLGAAVAKSVFTLVLCCGDHSRGSFGFFFFKHTVFSGLLRLGKPWTGIAQD